MILRILIAMALFLAWAALVPMAMQSQIIQQPLLQVDVPFKFFAGGMHLPAGEYTVSHFGPSLIRVWHASGRAGAFLIVDLPQAASSQPNPKLVFRRYGDTYFLAQVWTGSNDHGHECFPSSREKQLQQTLREQLVVVEPGGR